MSKIYMFYNNFFKIPFDINVISQNFIIMYIHKYIYIAYIFFIRALFTINKIYERKEYWR
jgi:hypothetical protein